MKISEDAFDNLLLSTHSDNIRDEYRNKHYNRFKTMGRLNRYETHRFINTGEKLEVLSYRHNLRGRSVSRLIEEVKKSPKEHIKLGLPLPITSDCHLVGVVKGKTRRSTSVKRTYEKDGMIDYFNYKVDTGYEEDEFNHRKVFNGD
jgi:hypothetical protein